MLKKHHRLNSPGGLSCYVNAALASQHLSFDTNLALPPLTTSLCSTKEIQIRETVFPIIIIMYSLDGVN